MLKRLLADAELEKDALKEIARGTSEPGATPGCRAPPDDRDRAIRAVGVPRHRPAALDTATRTTGDDAGRPDAALRTWLRDWAKDHPRHGFRNAYADARGEGWAVN